MAGALPPTAKLASRSGSMEISACPFTRNVSPTPGTMNSSDTRGSAMMFSKLSIRLLPCQSGSARVCGSRTVTTGPSSPRGEPSVPSGPTVVRMQKRERSIH